MTAPQQGAGRDISISIHSGRDSGIAESMRAGPRTSPSPGLHGVQAARQAPWTVLFTSRPPSHALTAIMSC